MTLPAKNAPWDDWEDWALDREGVLRERHALARRMLRRFQRGWQILAIEGSTESCWVHLDNTYPGAHFDRPDMALTPDESALWESIRSDPMDAERSAT